MGECFIIRRGSGMSSKGVPDITYTGTYSVILEDDIGENWFIKFTSSGILTLKRNTVVDAVIIGGGGAGQEGTAVSRNGGGSGYNQQPIGIELVANTRYEIIVGDGGARNSESNGGASSAFGYTANGGQSGKNGRGGTRTGAATSTKGTDGEDGFLLFDSTLLGYVCGSGGSGSSQDQYTGYGEGGLGGGGDGGYLGIGGKDGEPNTGGGGGGGGYNPNGTDGDGGAGGSGIVVIRNSR